MVPNHPLLGQEVLHEVQCHQYHARVAHLWPRLRMSDARVMEDVGVSSSMAVDSIV